VSEAPRKIRVVLIEDERLILSLLSRMLAGKPDIEVVAAADNPDEGLEAIAREHPDVVVLDIHLRSARTGIHLLPQIIERSPQSRVLMLSADDDPQTIVGALRAGASGYLSKNVAPELLVHAVHTLHGGSSILEPELTLRLIDEFERLRLRRPVPEKRLSDLAATLSGRERQILVLVGLGRTNKEIAEDLGLSESTVEAAVNTLLGRLELRDRVHLMLFCREYGIRTEV
jgi:DNA-binding NarL/FixJ family response regulator